MQQDRIDLLEKTIFALSKATEKMTITHAADLLVLQTAFETLLSHMNGRDKICEEVEALICELLLTHPKHQNPQINLAIKHSLDTFLCSVKLKSTD